MIKIYSENSEDYKEIITLSALAVLKHFDIKQEQIDVEINIVSAQKIQEINKSFREIDSITDVLSFPTIEAKLPLKIEDYPLDINPENNCLMLGEVFICAERAIEQAKEYEHSIEREMSFLICHGMLHLLGFDHNNKEKEDEMQKIQDEILDNEMKVTRDAEPFSSGFVAIMGRPNSGKSTLTNAIVGEKVSIVSWKPQTTRNKILGIYNDKNTQIVLIDTPGLHSPKNNLGKFMMKSARAALDGVDAVIYIIDGEKGIDDKDKRNIESYLNNEQKVIVAVNKIDHIMKEKVFEIMTSLGEFKNLEAIIPISALKGKNVDKVLVEIKKLLTDTIQYYPNDIYTDKNMRFMAAEIIREKALRLLDQEVPYGIGVDIKKYELRKGDKIIDIDADIICEKPAHKPIILGKGGSMIKKLATYARQDIEEMTGKKVFITVYVKVKEDWRGSDFIMKELGYDN